MNAPATQRKPSGSLGCFGLLCIPCLMLFTVLELGALWWLNPGWLDRSAFWRGKIVPADDIDTSPAARPKRFSERLPKL